MPARKPLVKSKFYIETYEKPKLVEYFNKLPDDLNWDEFAKTMKLGKKERKEKLAEMYDNGILPAIRAAVLSQIQASKGHAGKELEDKVHHALTRMKISFGAQVPIIDGKIVEKRAKNNHILDFILPAPVVGDSLDDYVVLSTKTSLRERFLQDNGIKCKQVLFITHDQESPVENKIVVERKDEDVDAEITFIISSLEEMIFDKNDNVAT